jgi:hypothetical protein
LEEHHPEKSTDENHDEYTEISIKENQTEISNEENEEISLNKNQEKSFKENLEIGFKENEEIKIEETREINLMFSENELRQLVNNLEDDPDEIKKEISNNDATKEQKSDCNDESAGFLKIVHSKVTNHECPGKTIYLIVSLVQLSDLSYDIHLSFFKTNLPVSNF